MYARSHEVIDSTGHVVCTLASFDEAAAEAAYQGDGYAVRPSALVLICGATYPVREELKALGAFWHPASKGWFVPAYRADEARALVGGGRRSRVATAAIVDAPQLATPDPVVAPMNARIGAVRPVARAAPKSADVSGAFTVRDVLRTESVALPGSIDPAGIPAGSFAKADAARFAKAASPVAVPSKATLSPHDELKSLKGSRLALYVQTHAHAFYGALGFDSARTLLAFVRKLDSKALESYVAGCLAHHEAQLMSDVSDVRAMRVA